MGAEEISALLESVALERYILRKSEPLLQSGPEAPSVYDLENDTMRVSLSVSLGSGMSLAEAVERLGIRPLLFGAAWKVFDLMLEVAYESEGLTPRKGGTRWPISEKVERAKAGVGQALPLSDQADLWRRLTAAYAATHEIRHALTHRKTEFDARGTLISFGNDGTAGGFITLPEQTALMRAAQRILNVLEDGTATDRDMAALLADLDQLHRLTKLPHLGLRPVVRPPAQFTLPVRFGQVVDLARLKRALQAQSPQVSQIDVTFDFGVEEFRMQLEHLPEEIVKLSVDLDFFKD